MDYNCGVDCSIFGLSRHFSLENLTVLFPSQLITILWLFISIIVDSSATPTDNDEPKNEIVQVESVIKEKQADKDVPTEDTAEEEEPTTEELLQQIDLNQFDLPIVINESVIYWVEHFSNSGRWTASRWPDSK